ncbi:MAG: RNA methyltransferase [Bdellovibrionaceae bacterium]|nr:RNA methyltransferase [Pseudobdellovibrionaceae bacterium]
MNRKIERIHELFLQIEKSHPHTGFETPLFDQLIEALKVFKDHKDVELFKIYSIHLHLKKDMPLRDFLYWIVPIERYLNKNLKDEDFIIFNKDENNEAHKIEKKKNPIPLVIVLDNIRSSFNVGSVFRTSEAFNIEKIILAGYSPDPSNPKTQKTTLGSHDYVCWETHPKCLDLVHDLKSQGYYVIAAETTSHAMDLEKPFAFDKKTVFIFGNERFGMDPQVIESCHETRKVPLQGIKNSLNVANAASIFIYEFAKQFTEHKTRLASASMLPGTNG